MAISLTLNNQTFHVGDTIRVHYRIIEKDVVSGKTKREKHEEQKERTQAFEGILIAIKGGGKNQSFTVRRLGADQIGIERIFPVISPWIKKVTIKKKGSVRRAKLYYLRHKTGRQISRLGTLVDQPAELSAKPEVKTEATPEASGTPTAPQSSPVSRSTNSKALENNPLVTDKNGQKE